MCLLQHIQTTKTKQLSILCIQSQFAVPTFMSTALKKYSKISKTVILKQFGNTLGSF